MKQTIKIGSRESRLAVIQTQNVINAIHKSHPEIGIELITMETTGDKRLDVTLDRIGGKGLFVKELDKALLDQKIDLAVHSLKDLPMEINPKIPVVAFSPREDVRDVLVLPEGVTKWTGRGVIGCSSFRRRIQGQRLYPEAEFKNIRGNVLTRLQKLDNGEYDALILAAAGLNRLGLEDRIYRYFSVEEILPAAGQGILAVQGRIGMDYRFLEDYGDQTMEYVAKGERAYVRYLDGGCSSPVAAYGEVRDKEGKKLLHLTGLYYIEDLETYAVGNKTGLLQDAEQIGTELAKELDARYGPC